VNRKLVIIPGQQRTALLPNHVIWDFPSCQGRWISRQETPPDESDKFGHLIITSESGRPTATVGPVKPDETAL
jgi:hypothetical protein